MRTAALLLILLFSSLHAQGQLRVAVAANFKPTLERINRAFEARTGLSVLLSSASTGMLVTQIEHGAPFDIFFAADRLTPMRIVTSRNQSGVKAFCYAQGSLVLAGGDTLAALANPKLSLAIANPVTAPYGTAAMQVLARTQFAAGSTRKLVRGNNVAQAYQFWLSGAVDLALLPTALRAPDTIPIPTAWHAPIVQYAVTLREGDILDTYLAWIRSDTVRHLIAEVGYKPCP
ncbi:MAG: molybdate ABC transporter substrate-binding protein [Halioglobus sp.]|nr:molybdate ABC transporter substrate-binding protein [Halioglobus sp.]